MPNDPRDVLDDFVNIILGAPPEGFSEKINSGMALCQVSDTLRNDGHVIDEDSFIIAGLATYMIRLEEADPSGKLRKPLGYILRAKQVVSWATEKASDFANRLGQTRNPARIIDEQELRNKTQEIARVISTMMFKDEGFLLLMFQLNTQDGHVAHCSDISRVDQIKLLEDHLARLKGIQAQS